MPSSVWWMIAREVLKPSAPALMPSTVIRAISRMSSGVASSRFAPRSPITHTRTAACGTWVAMSRSYCRFSSWSRYWGNVSHGQVSPSVSTTSGMSSTPSISATITSRWSGLHGAKPTPQLPTITVVTPCQDDGSSRSDQVA